MYVSLSDEALAMLEDLRACGIHGDDHPEVATTLTLDQLSAMAENPRSNTPQIQIKRAGITCDYREQNDGSRKAGGIYVYWMVIIGGRCVDTFLTKRSAAKKARKLAAEWALHG